MSGRRPLLDVSRADLEDLVSAWGEPAFRAGQVLDWVYARGARDFEEMTDLPKPLRDRFASEFSIRTGRELSRRESSDGTTKILTAWHDGATSECVMIPAPRGGRRTVCVSTQVGCDVGCRFCASGVGGSLRNLSVGEVVEQALIVSDLLRKRGERLSHVVFMGMGEPLANYRTTVESARRLNAQWGLGIGQRRITVSTVGLPKQIVRLADEGLQVTLALSLHAATEALRRELIPWAERLPLDEILSACRTYFDKTGREVTFEYCLLAGVNDGKADLEALSRLAVELRAHVNLMLFNPVPGLPFSRPSRQQAMGFLAGLRTRGVNAHLRESRGLEADAACGQLKRRLAE